MFAKVLVANRGAIACRIFRTLRRMGVASVAVYSDADRGSLHVSHADEAVRIGPAPAAQSYLCVEAILGAARRTGAEAIHPGYGFLSENAAFAERCREEGIVFIGPGAEHIRAFGRKHTAREIAARCAVPMLEGSGLLASADDARAAAERTGYPVILKATAGGGGIGMRVCESAGELADAFATVEHLSRANFKDGGIYLERFVAEGRHIEVQIFGDGRGGVIALGERDCSAQRRNQKVVEETPAPHLTPETRHALWDAAIRLGREVNYANAGTVEFLFDRLRGESYFLEVNTRLQVEHGVTEEVTGIDLVEWMVRQAAGEMPPLDSVSLHPRGHSIQVRLYAENPHRDFQPSSGLLTEVRFPEAARCDTWIEAGVEVTPYYDPLLAKVIVHAEDRQAAVHRMAAALEGTSLAGVETNLGYLRSLIADPVFAAGQITTRFLSRFRPGAEAIEVMEAGTQTTIQDFPGRLGWWEVGVPPSGPMDSLALRIANRLVGNAEGEAALECTIAGPTLRFLSEATLAIAGADMAPLLNGCPLPLCRAVVAPAGSVLKMGPVRGGGARAYLAVRGGFDVPLYLGSRSTFILGKFGGHAGRTLRPGDVLALASRHPNPVGELPSSMRPDYPHEWEIGVLPGPHGAPDFFTPRDLELFFETSWKVHHHSDRTGVRLIGPKPEWARPDGGEAGLHPSNIHDNPYAIGAIDYTGDMPVVLGPDGPSLGGFVCPATVVTSELWKLGQLRAGDRVRFRPVTAMDALRMERQQEQALATFAAAWPALPDHGVREPEIVSVDAPALRVARAAGDRNLLIEYGLNVLDFDLRFRAHALMEALRAQRLEGVIDLTPGIRSLQVHYDPRILPRERLLRAIEEAEGSIPPGGAIDVPSRVVHLPLSWDDPAVQLAIRRYMQSVRADAPWCPSNLEFIRRVNGLESIEDVRRIVFEAEYMVLGLGDVYLGAPVAVPVDPRHRLVTTKYNPARTWTPENAVGIGGAYLCVYGMEGPGGYQFVGRTVQMWNAWKQTRDFERPYLLRFFDRIRFHEVSAEELLELREEFPRGRYTLRVEHGVFSLGDHHRFLASIAAENATWLAHRNRAFEEERRHWASLPVADSGGDGWMEPAEVTLPEGCDAVRSPVTASVWNVSVESGQRVEAGQRLMVVEAMKMEVAVVAPSAGEVVEVLCKPGNMVVAGQPLALLRTDARV